MPAPRGLRDVQGEVAHPLDVAGTVDRRDHHAQVRGHRRLQREQAERLLLGRDAQVVDAGVVGDHLLGEVQVGLEQGAGRMRHRHRGLLAHVGERIGEAHELFLIDVAHGSSVVLVQRAKREPWMNRR